VREKEILQHRCARVLTIVCLGGLVVGACKSEASGPADTRASGTTPEPAGPAQPSAHTATPELDPAVAHDPERADKLADLDALCKAVDHDYDDGTLTDYYRDLEPRTEWGKAQRDAGNESIQPGRLLEKAVAELSPGAKDPALGHCRKLLDYLDDVE
jgi:hypothetical protein